MCRRNSFVGAGIQPITNMTARGAAGMPTRYVQIVEATRSAAGRSGCVLPRCTHSEGVRRETPPYVISWCSVIPKLRWYNNYTLLNLSVAEL